MATVDRIHRFEIDGQPVLAYESGEHRLWRCDCVAFQRALGRGQEGRCTHVAVAIWHATVEGTLQPREPHTAPSERVD